MTPMITVCAMPQESQWSSKHAGYLAQFDAGSGAFLAAEKIAFAPGLDNLEPRPLSYRAALPVGTAVNNQPFLANGETPTPYLTVGETPLFMLAIAHDDFLIATGYHLMRVTNGATRWKRSYRDFDYQGPNYNGLCCALVRSGGRYYALVKTHLKQDDLANPTARAHYREIDIDNDQGALYSTWPSIPMPANGDSVLNGYEAVGQIWPSFECATVGYPGATADGVSTSEPALLTGPANAVAGGFEMSGITFRYVPGEGDAVVPVVVNVQVVGGNIVSKTESLGAAVVTANSALARLPASVRADMAAKSTAPFTGKVFGMTVGLGHVVVVVEKVPFWTNHRRTQETL